MRPRMLKGAIVERVQHRSTKCEGVVRLDKSSMTFFAQEKDGDPNSPQFTSKNGSEVRSWLEKALSRTTADDKLDWIPVIEIERTGERRYRYRDEAETHGESMGIEIDRFYLALSKDKIEWLKLAWKDGNEKSVSCIPENERVTHASHFRDGPKKPLDRWQTQREQFRLPYYSDGGGKVFLIFTEELWTGLRQVVKGVAAARKTLDELIATKQGTVVLAEIGQGKSQLLLGPGPKADA